jgi:hypothetical protein
MSSSHGSVNLRRVPPRIHRLTRPMIETPALGVRAIRLGGSCAQCLRTWYSFHGSAINVPIRDQTFAIRMVR